MSVGGRRAASNTFFTEQAPHIIYNPVAMPVTHYIGTGTGTKY